MNHFEWVRATCRDVVEMLEGKKTLTEVKQNMNRRKNDEPIFNPLPPQEKAEERKDPPAPDDSEGY